MVLFAEGKSIFFKTTIFRIRVAKTKQPLTDFNMSGCFNPLVETQTDTHYCTNDKKSEVKCPCLMVVCAQRVSANHNRENRQLRFSEKKMREKTVCPQRMSAY
jgi:hypothetical protein